MSGENQNTSTYASRAPIKHEVDFGSRLVTKTIVTKTILFLTKTFLKAYKGSLVPIRWVRDYIKEDPRFIKIPTHLKRERGLNSSITGIYNSSLVSTQSPSLSGMMGTIPDYSLRIPICLQKSHMSGPLNKYTYRDWFRV